MSAPYNQNESKGNIKHDAAKIRMELLPARALLDVAKVMTHGAAKYNDNNWRKTEGSSTNRYLGSLARHLNAIQRGEDFDPDSGLLHAAHLACNALFILEAQLQGLWVDDRTPDTDNNPYQGREERWHLVKKPEVTNDALQEPSRRPEDNPSPH